MTDTIDITSRAIGYQENLDSQILSYLYNRGIKDETIEAYSIGFCTTPYSMMNNRITFPLRDVEGETIAIQGRLYGEAREGAPKYWNTPYPKGMHLYGFYEAFKLIQEYKFCLIVEGPIDAITFSQMGIPAVALWGLQFTPQQAFMLASCCDYVVPCLDADKAGQTAIETISKRLAKYEVPIHVYRTEAKDINEDWVNSQSKTIKRIQEFIYKLYD